MYIRQTSQARQRLCDTIKPAGTVYNNSELHDIVGGSSKQPTVPPLNILHVCRSGWHDWRYFQVLLSKKKNTKFRSSVAAEANLNDKLLICLRGVRPVHCLWSMWVCAYVKLNKRDSEWERASEPRRERERGSSCLPGWPQQQLLHPPPSSTLHPPPPCCPLCASSALKFRSRPIQLRITYR